MITIKEPTETEIIIKKSRFLGLACRIGSEQEAQRILEQRRKQHYDARHHCFAYILESGAIRCGDDGEPQGTAGVPMLETLKKSGLSDVIALLRRHAFRHRRSCARVHAERREYAECRTAR